MKIVFVQKDTPEILPPVIPRIIFFAEHGYQVVYICTSMTSDNRMLFESKGVECIETQHKHMIVGHHFKVVDWLGFRSKVFSIIRQKDLNDALFYVCSAESILSLGKGFLSYRFILQSNELYDRFPLYRQGIKRYAQEAVAFVVPEFVRANICMYWYGLEKEPFVIPNQPYVNEKDINQEITNEVAKEIVSKMREKKIILYQGHITSGDRSLTVIAEALKMIDNDEYVLLLMGNNNNNSYENLKEIYPSTYYIPFVAPPHHLEITSHAYIGVLSYDRVSLNNLFCAPNKIYEYGVFNIPMLGNDIPGLRDTITVNRLGICTDFGSAEKVRDAIIKIDQAHVDYSSNVKTFYSESTFYSEMKKLLEFVEGLET